MYYNSAKLLHNCYNRILAVCRMTRCNTISHHLSHRCNVFVNSYYLSHFFPVSASLAWQPCRNAQICTNHIWPIWIFFIPDRLYCSQPLVAIIIFSSILHEEHRNTISADISIVFIDGSDYLPVPKREVSTLLSLGLNPLKRHINVSLRLRVMSFTFIR